MPRASSRSTGIAISTITDTRLQARISLELSCRFPECAEFAGKLLLQLNGGSYTWPMSVLELDRDPHEWLASLRTARKRATMATHLGYGMQRFERADYPMSVNAINHSMPVRQGRPMADSYMGEQTFTPVGEQPCNRHRVSQYGLFDKRGGLCAYTVIHRAGELALVSQILGHGDQLPDGIMHLLMVETYRAEHPDGGYLVYNRFDSGTEGLQQFKRWFRFQPTRVTWA